ncbi:nucleoporin Ndc1 [Onthophagus taurus]|uniref:nucleoporin Ndc1 n=1 Tax=Onthophagus taurus TaxID=166361 RepID=UPI0039BE9647
MDPNLQIKSNVGCKDLLLKKLSYAVISTVCTQILLLITVIVFSNWSLLNPTQWPMELFTTLRSFWTWFYLLPYLGLIFIQSLICAKDYVMKKNCSSTRIGDFLSMFTIHKGILLTLNVLGGGFFFWVYLQLIKSNLSEDDQKGSEVDENYFFMVMFGVWIGIWNFFLFYGNKNQIIFPVVQQRKWIIFLSKLTFNLKASLKDVFVPIFLYGIIYLFYGKEVQEYFLMNPDTTSSFNKKTIIYTIFLGALYILNTRLMRFFFEVFLTEHYQFLIHSGSEFSLNNYKDFTLKDGILTDSIPIVQHLACLDLFLLSNSPLKYRRESLYTLSQPGNHPHTWNSLIEAILNLLNEYTKNLNVAIANLLGNERKKLDEEVFNRNEKHFNYGNIRNMTLKCYEDPIEFVTINKRKVEFDENTKNLYGNIREKINVFIGTVKKRSGFEYLFEKLPESSVQYLLFNGQVIIWTVQGLASLIVASLTEDKFGVMQKDLPIILATLVELKTILEKLNRISIKKYDKLDDFSNKMRVNINSAIKRSLYQISNTFSPYINDLALNNDVLHVLNVYNHN